MATGSDEKELLTAGVTAVKKKGVSQEKEDKGNIKKSLLLWQLFLFTDQPCRPLCPKLWKGDGFGD